MRSRIGGNFMRIDKFLSEMGVATRTEARAAAKRGGVVVDGVPVKDTAKHINPDEARVVYLGREVVYKRFVYVMLHKPAGYVSATEDGRDPTVLELLPPQYTAYGLFPCGRLDKHTLGLMLLTDNGEVAHRLLSPRRHVSKRYAFRCKFPLTKEDCERFREGLVLEDGYETKPADIELNEDAHSGIITLVEGKYHQIKRMLEALHNQITYLERISFGPLTLPADLARGAWRELTPEEEKAILDAAK